MTDFYKPVYPIHPPDLGNTAIIDRLSKEHNVPVVIFPGFKNGVYIPYSPGKYKKSKSEIVNLINKLRNQSSGGIVIGESTMSPTIVAHELGHSKRGPQVLKNFMPSSYTFPIATTIGSIIAGEAFPESRREIAAGNILLNVLTGLPILYDEYKASKLGKDLYPKADKPLLDELLMSYMKHDFLKKRLAPTVLGALLHEVIT